jgi:hypothetical protein
VTKTKRTAATSLQRRRVGPHQASDYSGVSDAAAIARSAKASGHYEGIDWRRSDD